jgi:hypothetical protein
VSRLCRAGTGCGMCHVAIEAQLERHCPGAGLCRESRTIRAA